jgi:hypothetical protein
VCSCCGSSGKEFEEEAGGTVAGVGNHRRHDDAMRRGRLLRHRGFDDRQQSAPLSPTRSPDYTTGRCCSSTSPRRERDRRAPNMPNHAPLGRRRAFICPGARSIRTRAAKGRLPVSCTDRYPVNALDAWLAAATITEGPLFRWIWRLPSPRRAKGVRSKPAPARYRVGYANSIALTVQRWTGRAGFDGAAFARHSLWRGVISSKSPQKSASPASKSSPASLHTRAWRNMSSSRSCVKTIQYVKTIQ